MGCVLYTITLVVVVRILVVGKCRIDIMNAQLKPVQFLFMTNNIFTGSFSSHTADNTGCSCWR
jgi:hypothetical protein